MTVLTGSDITLVIVSLKTSTEMVSAPKGSSPQYMSDQCLHRVELMLVILFTETM